MSGFRVYHVDEYGNYLDEYDSVTFHKAEDGLIPFERFLKELPNDCFSQGSKGGVKYVVYDKNTKEVYHHIEYDNEDFENT